MNIENKVIFYLVFFIVMQVITSLSRKILWTDLVEKIALSHPEISIRFINNNQSRLHTSGNHNLKDIIYAVFGREITANLIEVDAGADPERFCRRRWN